ncbi:MAG: DUF1385 domain-containing protein [Nitrospirae bacterium]|nr:MAG: DUF1385 domain-containing protein [Nitrospirota bacterium]
MQNIGGQAVIEGVMMKSKSGWSVAVRGPKGDISFKTVKSGNVPKILQLPVVRGIVALFHALIIGVKAIEFSGSVAYQEDNDEKPVGAWTIGFSILAAIFLAMFLFKFLPLYITTLLSESNQGISQSSFLFNFIDGILRVGIFLLYIFSIGLWKEMRRIYEYHGAEHKVIYAFEAGEPLTVENARKYKPYHTRCGTSFLLIVMVLSIIIFMAIPKDWTFVEKLLSRLLLVPFIAGISYEFLKLSAKLHDNPVFKLAVLPGLLLQRMTVREPDDSQIEVAIAAVKEVLTLEPDLKEACGKC